MSYKSFSEGDNQSALLGLDKNWKHVKTVTQAQEAAKKMYRSLSEWKLEARPCLMTISMNGNKPWNLMMLRSIGSSLKDVNLKDSDNAWKQLRWNMGSFLRMMDLLLQDGEEK